MEKIVLKLEGFKNLDVRLLSEFLYNLKVYTTVLVELSEKNKEIANILRLKNINDFDTKYTARKIKNILNVYPELKYIWINSNEHIRRKGKYNVFHSSKVKLEIKDINRGSWFIEFLITLTPEQIEAYGNAISKIIFNTGLALTLYKLASNSKTAKYIKEIIAILKNDQS